MDGAARLTLAEMLRANRVHLRVITAEMRADMVAVAVDGMTVPTRVEPSRVLRVMPPYPFS